MTANNGSLGETRLADREDYSLEPSHVRKLSGIGLDVVEWLEAMIPTYESVLDANPINAGTIDSHKVTFIRGQREALRILRYAYDIQTSKA